LTADAAASEGKEGEEKGDNIEIYDMSYDDQDDEDLGLSLFFGSSHTQAKREAWRLERASPTGVMFRDCRRKEQAMLTEKAKAKRPAENKGGGNEKRHRGGELQVVRQPARDQRFQMFEDEEELALMFDEQLDLVPTRTTSPSWQDDLMRITALV
jgi:hypothetical protein